MTHRTLSLLMLFVVAFGVSAVLVAVIQPVAVRFALSTPWLVPLVGIVCYCATFFGGRRYILPYELANSSLRAALALAALVSVSMMSVYGVFWFARPIVGGLPGPFALLLWFVTLWTAIYVLHRAPRQRRLPLP
jgi:hypothetical protein